MKKNGIDLGLREAFDDLFSTQEDRDNAKRTFLRDIPVTEISDFPDHPFKVRMDEDMENLVESVKERGVLSPVLVRPLEDGSYQMVSGHRRKRASELAGLETVPCIVRELTNDEATILMVDSNLQRERVLPSERAHAYKMKLEAMKRQGQRTDLTSDPLGPKLRARSNQELADQSPDSKTQIQRYIRLTNLIPPLLDLVDEGKIAFRPAVELSYLTESEQSSLAENISYDEATPSLAQAIKMKDFSREGRLNPDVILSIMSEEKPNQREKYSFQADRLRQYIPVGLSPQQREDYVVKALEGTSTASMAKGAAHFSDTSIWDGNVCLAAHNRGTNAIFGKIHTLKAGDTITLTTKLGTRTYAVVSIEKVQETDTSGTAATPNNQITLYTCVMNERPYRWCVTAIEIS